MAREVSGSNPDAPTNPLKGNSIQKEGACALNGVLSRLFKNSRRPAWLLPQNYLDLLHELLIRIRE
jgi:hypothetical protein